MADHITPRSALEAHAHQGVDSKTGGSHWPESSGNEPIKTAAFDDSAHDWVVLHADVMIGADVRLVARWAREAGHSVGVALVGETLRRPQRAAITMTARRDGTVIAVEAAEL